MGNWIAPANDTPVEVSMDGIIWYKRYSTGRKHGNALVCWGGGNTSLTVKHQHDYVFWTLWRPIEGGTK